MSVEGLAADRAMLGRTSTAERVAVILRARISEGYFEPGARLSEKQITEQLDISRNTLREGFRLLTHERLLVHKLNQGVYVRVPDVADLEDLYRVRKHLECSVVRGVTAPPSDLGRLTTAVDEGRRALDDESWRALGTANIAFHEAITALAGSPRIDELMRSVLAELRLVFHVMKSARQFHEPYLVRNREVLAALAAGDGVHAEQLLKSYLEDSERQLVEAYDQVIADRAGNQALATQV